MVSHDGENPSTNISRCTRFSFGRIWVEFTVAQIVLQLLDLFRVDVIFVKSLHASDEISRVADHWFCVCPPSLLSKKNGNRIKNLLHQFWGVWQTFKLCYIWRFQIIDRTSGFSQHLLSICVKQILLLRGIGSLLDNSLFNFCFTDTLAAAKVCRAGCNAANLGGCCRSLIANWRLLAANWGSLYTRSFVNDFLHSNSFVESLQRISTLELLKLCRCVLIQELIDRQISTSNLDLDLVALYGNFNLLWAKFVYTLGLSHKHDLQFLAVGVVIYVLGEFLVDIVVFDGDIDGDPWF